MHTRTETSYKRRIDQEALFGTHPDFSPSSQQWTAIFSNGLRAMRHEQMTENMIDQNLPKVPFHTYLILLMARMEDSRE